MKKKCIHIIIRDKFTEGYISFLREYDFNWEHVFFTFDGKYELNTNGNDCIRIVKDYKEIIVKYNHLIKSCDRIVIAAMFDQALQLLKMPNKYWEKTYIQFWGGDIYRFRDNKKFFIPYIKQKIIKHFVKKAIQKAKGILTLVDGDYYAIEEIFGIKKTYHKVVQVPDDFYQINHIDYNRIICKNKTNKKKRIIIGNSATKENKHKEIFEILSNKIDESCEILVPLSYGDNTYRENIIKEGKDIFKNSFIPILKFMPRDEYIKLLSTCDVAIFNNDRQQATGNIIILANIGKKLYLRNDTTMWDFFKNLNFNIHSVADLEKENLNDIFSYTEKERNINYIALNRMEKEAIKQWRDFLND